MNCVLSNFWSFEAFSCLMVLIISFSAYLQLSPKINLGYGKFLHNSAILVPAWVAWIIYESPNLIMSFYFLFFNGFPMKIPNLLLLLMYMGHYINRTFIYPLKLKGNARKYPLDIASNAIIFCSFNGYFQLYSLKNLCIYDDSWVYSWCFIFGVIIFFLGMFINIKSDNILVELKKRKIESLNKEDKTINIENSKNIYSIPDEFLFKYVSSANYLGEVIEWLGYGIAGWSFNGFIFAITTFNILLSRALKNRKWYIDNFKEYPKERKALIPFII